MKRFTVFASLILVIFLFISCEQEVPVTNTANQEETSVTTYKVKYELHNGQPTINESVATGSKITAPTTPTDLHYIFDGWFTDETYTSKWNFETDTVTNDVTLHAKWNKQVYTITFKNNANETISTSQVAYNCVIQDNQIPSIVGFKCSGIFKDQNCSDQFDKTNTISDNLTLYVTFDEETFSLPVVHINSNDTNITKEEWINGIMDITGADKEKYNLSDVSITIKGRGNSSWNMPKKSYSIKLDKKENLFGIANGKHKQYALIANYADKTLLRNQLAYYWGNTVFTNMDWNSHTQPVNLFLNGEFLGIYLLAERIKINENLVDIDEISDTNPNGDWIVEVNERLDETYNWRTNKGFAISLKEPDDYAGYQSIQAAINNIENTLYDDANWLDSSNGWRSKIDEDSFIDWFLVNELAKNCDASWFSSVYMYYSSNDSKLHMGPLWDFDIGFGNINYNGCDNSTGWWIKNSGWHARLFQDPTFVANVKARWDTIKNNLDIDNTISAMAYKLVEDSNLNFQKWDILGKYVWPNADGYETRTTYYSEVEYLITWTKERFEWLDTNINSL